MSSAPGIKTFSRRPAPDEGREWTRCAICGSDWSSPVWHCGTFGFVRCRRCGHLYQNPRPDFAALRKRYDENYLLYELDNEAVFLRLMLKGLADVGFAQLTRSIEAPRSFLDIGCATGALLEHLRTLGWQVQGVELCPPAARYGIECRRLPIHIGTIEQAAFPPQSFSIVHSSHVIEHVAEPRSFLTEIARILRPGGYLITVTPDSDGLQARLTGARWRSAIADHLSLFSARNLRRLLQESGLQPLVKRSWGGLARGLAPAPIKSIVDRLARLGNFGDVMLILARR